MKYLLATFVVFALAGPSSADGIATKRTSCASQTLPMFALQIV